MDCRQRRTTVKIFRLLFIISLLISITGFSAKGQLKKLIHSYSLYTTMPTLTWIDSEKADNIGIKKLSYQIEFGLGVQVLKVVKLSIGVGFGRGKDSNGFAQNTTSGILDSKFTIFNMFASGGLVTPEIKLPKFLILTGVNVGYERYSGEREIVNCVNCHNEDYNFEAGLFVEPEINILFKEGAIGLGTAYRYYLGEHELNGSWVVIKLVARDVIGNSTKKNN